MKQLLCPLLVVFQMVSCNATSSPIEAGTVTWGRDLDAALALSRQSGKPVFALFQEIPGCAGCQQFGRDVLSHPVLVEAIETEFTPLLIHNNKPGRDADVLQRFGEPAWNFQVVRFLDAEARDIIPRRDHVWDTKGIADRMIATLQAAKRPVPAYLSLLASEHSPQLEQAVFSMYCFWSGEVALGLVDGVVTTQAGFSGGHEVVRVRYDPSVVSLADLRAVAEKKACRHLGTAPDYRAAPAGDQKKQLEGTVLATLPLTPAQATKFNAWRTVDLNKAASFLAPSQRAGLR
ncbi:MAG TPA: VPGUxxT family thioredoxin-like (seleno)protein, type 2 [Prosthecobacter sp.]